jgi:hypothetical protein
VHGCFWHLHRNCKDARIPKARPTEPSPDMAPWFEPACFSS